MRLRRLGRVSIGGAAVLGPAGSSADVAPVELGDLEFGDAGDKAEVVVGPASGVTLEAPAADVAVVFGVGICVVC
jgi:hypothetical protein